MGRKKRDNERVEEERHRKTKRKVGKANQKVYDEPY